MCFCERGSRKGNRKALESKLTGACWTSFSKNNVWAGFFANVLGNDLLPPRRKQSFVDGEVFTDPSSGPG